MSDPEYGPDTGSATSQPDSLPASSPVHVPASRFSRCLKPKQSIQLTSDLVRSASALRPIMLIVTRKQGSQSVAVASYSTKPRGREVRTEHN